MIFSPRRQLTGRGHIRSRSHRKNNVFAFLAVGLRNAKQHFILANPELRRLAHWQKHGVLVIFRPDTIGNALGLQHVLLTQQLLGVLMLAVGSKNLAGDGLAIFFGVTASR